MHLAQAQTQFEQQAATIAQIVRNVSPEQARWKPAEDAWSILEVINHLYDEEHEDFRLRLDLTLHQPGQPFPPIDPPAAVITRRYNERDLGRSLANFLDERARSLAWLQTLDNPQWDTPSVWLRAGDILVAWLAHDLLHLRQLVELHYLYHAAASQPFRVDYAGDW
jgi:uncharacterized damage-inducible protein DinB